MNKLEKISHEAMVFMRTPFIQNAANAVICACIMSARRTSRGL